MKAPTLLPAKMVAEGLTPSVSEMTVRLLGRLREFYTKNQARTAKFEYEKEPVP